jgi:hypothetical protein
MTKQASVPAKPSEELSDEELHRVVGGRVGGSLVMCTTWTASRLHGTISPLAVPASRALVAPSMTGLFGGMGWSWETAHARR